MTLFLSIQPGLESVLIDELRALGHAAEVAPGGVRVNGDAERIVPLTWTLRTPTAAYLELVEGVVRAPPDLVGLVRKVRWKDWLLPTAKVTVEATSKASRLRFTDSIEGKVGHALTEARKGPRIPELEKRAQAPQVLRVRLQEDTALLSLDAGGELLHRRGWREDSHAAPIRENLAAAVILKSGWTPGEAFYDPFCGVGTFPIEAAAIAAGRSPHGRRHFACAEWPSLKARPPKPPKRTRFEGILGSDKEPRAVLGAQKNGERAGVELRWSVLEIGDIQPPAAVGTIVTNPPYGHRLGQNVQGLYARFGQVLRERFGGWRVVFLCPDGALARVVDKGVRPLLHFPNGGLKVTAWAFTP